MGGDIVQLGMAAGGSRRGGSGGRGGPGHDDGLNERNEGITHSLGQVGRGGLLCLTDWQVVISLYTLDSGCPL